MSGGKRYRAFISYSQQDRAWARRLHSWLENYRLPKGVLPDRTDSGKLGQFFRDEEDMSAASDIREIVQRSIEESESLIVICSPRSAKSRWVEAEIQHFRATGRSRKIFAFIIDGSPNTGDPDTECFPLSFRTDFPEEGSMPTEPLGLNVRIDGRDRSCARLAAGLLDIRFDDLWQRENRRRRIRAIQTQALFAGGAALVAAGLTGGYFAAANFVDASQRKAELLAGVADQFLEKEYDPAKALLAAVVSDPAAQGGLAQSLMRPNGYKLPLVALERAYLQNRLFRTFASGGDAKRFSQDDILLAAAFSPDGKSVVTAGGNGDAKVWRVSDGRVVATLSGHEDAVCSVAFSTDGSAILTGSWDGTSRLWSPSGKNISTIRNDSLASFGGICSIATGPTSTVALGTMDKKLIVLRPGDAKPLELPFDSSISDLDLSPNDLEVALGLDNGTAAIVSVADGQVSKIFGKTGDDVKLAYSPDGTTIVTGSSNGDVSFWSGPDYATPRTIKVGQDAISDLAFSPDGAHLAVAEVDGRNARVLNVFSGEQEILLGAHRSGIAAIAYSKDGSQVLTAAYDGTAKVWDVRDRSGTPPVSMQPGKIAVAASSADTALFVVGAADGSAGFWRKDHNESFWPLPNKGAAITAVAISPDKKRAMLGYKTGAATVFDIATGKPVKDLPGHGVTTSSVGFSDDNSRIYVGYQDGSVVVSSATDWVELVRLPEFEEGAGIDPATESNLATLSPDTTLAAVSAADDINLWNLGTKEKLQTLSPQDGWVRAMSFSKDGKRLLVGANGGGTARLWSVPDATTLATFELSGSGAVPAVALLNSSRLVLTGTSEGWVILWSDVGGAPLAVLARRKSPVVALAPLSDETGVVAIYGDGVARTLMIDPILRVNPREKVRLACDLLREIGVETFSEADRHAHAILPTLSKSPCGSG
jgi:WD40 repeat protein